MADIKKFDLIVEDVKQYGPGDQVTIKTTGMELNNLVYFDDSPPDIIIMPGGTMLIKTGRYVTEGNRYCYRIATVANLVGGKLEPR